MESDCIEIEIKKSSNFFSPLRYPGGKSSLSKFFSKVLDEISVNGYYVEPYAGGAGAALELLFHERIENIVINDYDRSIYAIWYCILNKTDELIQKVLKSKLTIKEWYVIKSMSKNKKANLIDLGYAAFYLNRTNRSGIVKGGPIGGIEQNGKWKIDARFNKNQLVERIEKIASYKKRIKLYNKDGIELMQNYKKENNSFIYVDPPYYDKGSSLYYNHYKENDHKLLSNFLNKNNRMNWILTYDNVEPIRNLYSKRKQQDFNINYHAASPRVGNEIMIFSDKMAKKMYDL